MSLKYESYNPKAGAVLGPCGFCREDLSDGQLLVAHEGQGALHPFHETCIKSAQVWAARCPLCESPTDISPLFTCNERVVGKIQTKLRHGAVGVYESGKLIAFGALVGSIIGAISGSAATGASVGVQLTSIALVQMPVVDLAKSLRSPANVVDCAAVGGLALSILLRFQGPGIFLTAVVISGVIVGLLNPSLHDRLFPNSQAIPE